METPSQQMMLRQMTKGAGILGSLVILSAFTPLFGFFFSLLIPLPVLYYRALLGRRSGAFVPLGVMALLAIVSGGMSVDLLFFAGLMLLGFMIGEMFESDRSLERMVVDACGTTLGGCLALLIIYTNVTGGNLFDMVSGYVNQNLQMTLQLYKEIGMPDESIQMISASLDKIQYVLVRTLPSMIIASTLLVAWMTIVSARFFFLKKGLYYPDFGPFNRWKAPDALIWAAILFGAMLMIPNTGLKLMGMNGLIVLMTIYFFSGIAVVSHFFERKQFPLFLRVILYTLIALQQLALLGVIGLGIFDMWINFRKLNTDKE